MKKFRNGKKETVKDLLKVENPKWYSQANDRSDELEDLTNLFLNRNQEVIDNFRMMQATAF